MFSTPIMQDFTCCYLIPARGGSKRIPDKNVAVIGAKPLIQWPISEAWEMNIHPLVSTDSDKIAEQSCGAGVLKRPDELATDDCDRWGFLDYHFGRGELEYDLIGVRQCTSPFFGTENAEACFKLSAMTGKCVSAVTGSMGKIAMRKVGGLYVIPRGMIPSGEYRLPDNWRYVTVDEFSGTDIDTLEDLEKAREAWNDLM